MSIYFKQSTEYANGQKAAPSYHRFSDDGKIITVSTYRKTISFPKSLIIQKGFEIITEEEFKKVLKETFEENDNLINTI